MQAEMDVQLPVETQIPRSSVPQEWQLATGIAFRFTFVYLILYSFPFPLQHLPWLGGYISQSYTRLWQAVIPWIGNHILRIGYEIPIIFSGSGDKTYDWVQFVCFLALAGLATVLWSLLAHRQSHYQRLHRWLTLYMRFVLAGWMLIYGSMKAIPVQMSEPRLTRLLEQYGDFSPMGVLWSFMGASPTYTSITGSVELLGGVLLIFPRTSLLGAIVSFAAMTQVFILNMCYDVPVKLFSFHLMLMSLFLIAPHLRRITNLLLLNRTAEPASEHSLFKRTRYNRGLWVAQIAFGLYLLGTNLYGAYQAYHTFGSGSPKPPLYGIWQVSDLTIDGVAQPPLLSDQSRWRRWIIQNSSGMYIQPMQGPSHFFRTELDTDQGNLTLSKANDEGWKAEFTFQEAAPGELELAGEFEGRRTEAKLVRQDESEFLLRSRGFHWIQERPFNR